MRCCTATPPPSAAMRSMRSEMVSAWSKNQFSPSSGTSRLTFSNTSSARLMVSS
jgi:hypothetical protein